MTEEELIKLANKVIAMRSWLISTLQLMEREINKKGGKQCQS